MAKKKRRTPVEAARKRREEREAVVRAEKKKRNKKFGKFAIAFVCALVAVSLAALLAANLYVSSGAEMRGKTAAKSDNFEVNGAMMSYFIYDAYNSFLDYYGNYVTNFGLDTNKSLKTQNGPDGESWYKYFVDDAKATVEETLKLCEQARAEGISLTSKETAAVTEMAEATKTKLYGRGVKVSDIEDSMTLLALALKYKSEVYGDISVSDEDIAGYYKDHQNDFDKVGTKTYTFEYDPDKEFNYDKAKQAADKLTTVKSAERFDAMLTEVLKERGDTDSNVEKAVNASAVDVAYEDTDTVKKLFAADTGETFVFEDAENKKITVYLVLSTAAPDKSETVDVRNILFSATSCGTMENAKVKADEIYALWKSGEATEESFAELARLYSADFVTAYDGGLFPGVVKGEAIEAYDAWCYDEERKAGDTGVVSTVYGYYMMYYIGEGRLAYESDIEAKIKTDRYDEAFKAFSDKYTVTYTDDVLDVIPA